MASANVDRSAGDAGAEPRPSGSAATVATMGAILQQASQHLAAGEIASAKSLLDNGNWPDTGVLRLLKARIAEAEGRSAAAIELFRSAATALGLEVEQASGNANKALALAQALIKCGNTNAADAALALARHWGIDTARAVRLERMMAWTRREWAQMRRIGEEIVRSDPNAGAPDYVALAVACRKLDDVDGAERAARRALERNPADVQAGMICAWTAMRQGDAQKAIACYRHLSRIAPNNPKLAFEIVRLLVLDGSVADGSAELDSALRRWPNDPSIRMFALICGFRSVDELSPFNGSEDEADIDVLRERQMRRAIDRAPHQSQWRRPIVVDDKSRDVIVAASPGSTRGILVFTALNDVVSLPLPIFDRYLAALGITAIYLKDFERLSFLKGIASLGDYPATLRALRKSCDELGILRLSTLGYSAGGIGAIRYAVELGADRALSFAGETHISRGETARLEQDYMMIKRRLDMRVPPADRDLKEFLNNRRYTTKIDLIYGSEEERDRAHAEYLSGVGRVTLRPVVGCPDHELIRWLALHADLRSMLLLLLEKRSP